MAGPGRGIWLLLALAPLSGGALGCAALTGLSDFQRDDCAFGCDGGGPDATTRDGMGGDATVDVGSAEAQGDGRADAPTDGRPADAPQEAPSNCGNLGQACCSGACNMPLTCQADHTCGCGTLSSCGTSCVDETTDPQHCGACGHVCPAGTHQMASCSSSMCSVACQTGYADCADAGTACATSTASDPANCGACGHACPLAGEMCSGGVCMCAAGAQVCGTQCIDTSSDKNNCGSCAHSCLGGLCSGGKCQPVTLASGVTAPVGIALDTSFVYYTSPTDGTVAKVPVGGGSPVPIASGQIAPTGVAVDAVNVYWANNGPNGTDGSVMKAALPNGSPAPLVPGVSALYLVSSGTTLYFTRGQFGAVLSVPVIGGGTTPVWTSNKFPYGIAMDANNVYWGVFNNNVGVYEAAVASGSPTQFVSGFGNTQQVAADGTNVYFTTYFPSGGVYMTDPNGLSVTPLATGQPRPFGVAVHGSEVYFTTSTAVMRVSTAGGSPTQLAADTLPQQIAVDGTAIYWASGTGAILKLAK
jgi:hypothetical protein